MHDALATINHCFRFDRNARVIKGVIDLDAAIIEAHIGNAARLGNFSGIVAGIVRRGRFRRRFAILVKDFAIGRHNHDGRIAVIARIKFGGSQVIAVFVLEEGIDIVGAVQIVFHQAFFAVQGGGCLGRHALPVEGVIDADFFVVLALVGDGAPGGGSSRGNGKCQGGGSGGNPKFHKYSCVRIKEGE